MTESIVQEIWKAIPGYVGAYDVSSLGRVKSRKTTRNTFDGRVLRAAAGKSCRYPAVTLSLNGTTRRFTVHSLVALAFLGACPKGKEINHIDGNKANPALDNLEHITHKANAVHAAGLGLYPAGEQRPDFKLTHKAVTRIRKRYAEGGVTLKSLGAEYGVSFGLIGQIVRMERRAA